MSHCTQKASFDRRSAIIHFEPMPVEARLIRRSLNGLDVRLLPSGTAAQVTERVRWSSIADRARSRSVIQNKWSSRVIVNGGLTMKLGKSLLLGSAAALAATVGAQAADLPMRKSAPVDYVRVCDWTGAGYFYIPGSDTCMNIGGLVRAEYAYINTSRAYNPASFAGTVATGNVVVPGGTIVPRRFSDQSGFFASAVVLQPIPVHRRPMARFAPTFVTRSIATRASTRVAASRAVKTASPTRVETALISIRASSSSPGSRRVAFSRSSISMPTTTTMKALRTPTKATTS